MQNINNKSNTRRANEREARIHTRNNAQKANSTD